MRTCCTPDGLGKLLSWRRAGQLIHLAGTGAFLASGDAQSVGSITVVDGGIGSPRALVWDDL